VAGRLGDTTPPTRFGLIGCGAVGSLLDEGRLSGPALTHASAITRSARADLAAVCDVDSARADACAAARGVARSYVDAATMLDAERLDAVVIATPPTDRLDIIEHAVDSGVRLIFCEKPLATTAAEARRLEGVVPHNVVFAVNYLRRWAPLAPVLRVAVERELGRLQTGVAWYGKGLLNNGGHHLDLLSMLFGLPNAVRAVTVVDDARAEDPTVSAALTYNVNGADFPVFLLGTDHRPFQVFELELLGTDGRLRVLDGGRVTEHQQVIDDPVYPGYRVLAPPTRGTGGLAGAFEAALEQLLDVVAGIESEPRCTLADGIAVVETAESILASVAR